MGLEQRICLAPLPGKLLSTLEEPQESHLLRPSSVQGSQGSWDCSPSVVTHPGFVPVVTAGLPHCQPRAPGYRGVGKTAACGLGGTDSPAGWAQTGRVPCWWRWELTLGTISERGRGGGDCPWCWGSAEGLNVQLCLSAGFGLGMCLTSPALLPVTPAAPSQAGDENSGESRGGSHQLGAFLHGDGGQRGATPAAPPALVIPVAQVPLTRGRWDAPLWVAAPRCCTGICCCSWGGAPGGPCHCRPGDLRLLGCGAGSRCFSSH